MASFTIEHVVDYFISQDSMRAEDWKTLKQKDANYLKKAMCKISWLVSKFQSLELSATANLK